MTILEWVIAGIIVSILFLVVLCLVAIFGPDRGQAGEISIYKMLEKLEGRTALLPNCYLPKQAGGTTEVDLILLHESGIYVIESKNYSGWIFGCDNQKYWTQSLPSRYKHTEKHGFYNPIWQNNTHIRCLRRLLDDDRIPCYSYVVFGNDCELKNVRLTNSVCHVTQRRYLLRDIAENAQRAGRCLSDEQIDTIYATLVQFTGATDEQKEKHIEEIRAKQCPVVQPDGTWTCPLCGGVLVKRVVRRGSRVGSEFWGCSNYPKCRFIYNE